MRVTIPLLITLLVLNAYLMTRPGQEEEQHACLAEQFELAAAGLELNKARDEILVLKALLNAYREANTRELRLTAYTARPEECNEDVNNTAVMVTPVPGLTAAVSRDLKGWLGKRVYVQGFGVRLVSDLMHPRFVKSMDLLVENVETAMEIGVMQDVRVTLIEPLDQVDGDIPAYLMQYFKKQ